MGYIKWDQENITKLVELFNTGLSYKMIAQQFNCSEQSIKSQCSLLGRKGVITPRRKGGRGNGSKKGNREWDQSLDLLELVQKYKTFDRYRSSVLQDKLPPISLIQKTFGSWTNARKAAGLPESVGCLKDYAQTMLYLLYFEEEDFYKVGFTQRQLSERFAGYPKYKVLDTVTLSLLEVLENERALKSVISEYQYSPSHPKFYRENKGGAGGHTECFKPKEMILTLEDVFELRQ